MATNGLTRILQIVQRILEKPWDSSPDFQAGSRKHFTDVRDAATHYFLQKLNSPADLPFRLTTVA